MIEIFNKLLTQGIEAFGRYYGSYRGYVIDNEDPEGFGRLKIMVPQITGIDVIDYWAWPKGVYSGKGYGSQIIPEKKDMVWVEFEYGSPRKPIWMHGHFANQIDDKTSEKPDELKDIKNFWFKTPGGHIVEMDDTNQWVKVTTSKGVTLQMDEDVVIRTYDSQIVMASTGITIDAGENKVFINGEFQVLYAKTPGATEILDVSQIGVSQSVKVGL